MMSKLNNEFKNKHFTSEVTLWAVRWYCQFAISYRDIVIRKCIFIVIFELLEWLHLERKHHHKYSNRYSQLRL